MEHSEETPNSQMDIYELCKRTLSRDITDRRPLPEPYFTDLIGLQKRQPADLNFLMNLEEEGGTITCLDCWEDVACGIKLSDGIYAFHGFRPWEAHIRSPQHVQAAASRYLRDNAYTSISPGTPSKSRIPHSSEALSTVKKEKRTQKFEYPDGEIIEISDDDDNNFQVLAPKIESFISNTGASSTTGLHPSGLVPSSFTFGRYNPRQHVGPVKGKSLRKAQFPDGEVIVFSSDEDDDEMPVAGPSSAPTHRWPGQSTDPFQQSFVREGASLSASKRKHDFLEAVSLDEEYEDEIDYETDYSNQLTPNSSVDSASSPSKRIKYFHTNDMDTDLPVGPSSSGAFSSMPHFGMPGAWGSLHHQYGLNEAGPSTLMYPAPQFGNLGNWNGGPGHRADQPPIEDLYGQSGFSAGYDEGDPISKIDMSGPDKEAKFQEFIQEVVKEAEPSSVDIAVEELGLESRHDPLPGMNIVLKPFQILGVAWMAKQETGAIRGGILADEMGLGKTVQTISLLVKRQPPADVEARGTLIVAPAALLEQWKQEIRDKTEDGLFRVHIHHGSDKLPSEAAVKKFDIVITTYQTLCGDFPKKRKKNAPVDQVAEEEFEDLEKPTGPLGKTRWHRIVLDEAQFIRNRSTQASVRMAWMKAKYRWCLTGTPVTNSLVDIYGLTRFLRFSPWDDWKFFNDRIGKVQKRKPEVAGSRAQVILKATLLRRTKKSMVEGQCISDLPPKIVEVLEVAFTPEEREIYNTVELNAKMRVSKFLKAGTVMKNYHVILVLILRLRQVTSHPRLIAYQNGEGDGESVQGDDDNGERPSDMDPLSGNDDATIAKRAIRDIGPEFVDQVRQKFSDIAYDRMKAEANGEEYEEEDTECPICFDEFTIQPRIITSCKHQFCLECITDVLNSPLRQQDAVNLDDAAVFAQSRPCPVCRSSIDKSKIFKASAFEPIDAELEDLQAKVNREKNGIDDTDDEDDEYLNPSFIGLTKGKGKAKAKPDPAQDAVDIGAFAVDEMWEPSAKMIKMLELIEGWLVDTDDQIVLFSQWTSMIDLVEELLQRNAISILRYDGKMSQRLRNETLNKFKKDKSYRILVVSLKCGGVGLNLTNANRCINLDLAWNNATEEQAVDRLHRFGQDKEVFVNRIVVADTIESRIMMLQKAKQELADAALAEGKFIGKKGARLTIQDIKLIFDL